MNDGDIIEEELVGFGRIFWGLIISRTLKMMWMFLVYDLKNSSFYNRNGESVRKRVV